MAHITRVDISMIELKPKVERKDAIQSFMAQETPIVTIYDSDGVIGTGYSYHWNGWTLNYCVIGTVTSAFAYWTKPRLYRKNLA